MAPDNNIKQKLTDRLNETGFPFQEWCFACVKKYSSRRSLQEFPFTFPLSTDTGTKDVASIDILSLKIPKDSFHDLCWIFYFIECKKSKSGIKNWCFLKSTRSDKSNSSVFFAGQFCECRNEEEECLDFRGRFFEQSVLFGDEIDVAIHGYEVNNNLVSLNRNQEEKIYKSAMQSIRACAWLEAKDTPIIPELVKTEEVQCWTSAVLSSSGSKYPYIIFMPVLVTTSDIFVGQFDAGSVLGETGEIHTEDVSWEKKDWVIYDIGLPDWLQNESSPSSTRGVVVVNQDAFEKLLGKDFDRYGFKGLGE